LSSVTIAFLVSWNCNAQVYSQGIFSAGTTYYGDHCIGSSPLRFGFSEYSYRTDASGQYIWYPQPGDTEHRRTWIYFGPTSFSVPMRPLPFLIVSGTGLLVALALGDFGWKHLRRRRYETRAA